VVLAVSLATAIVYLSMNSKLDTGRTTSSESNTSAQAQPSLNFSLQTNITVSDAPWDIAYSPNGYLYVTSGTGSVSVISGSENKVVANIKAGPIAKGIIYDSSNNMLYLTTASGSSLENFSVAVINASSNRIVQYIPGGFGAGGEMAYDFQNHRIYVSDVLSGNVTVIDDKTNAIVEQIPLGGSLGAICYDPNNGNIYVSQSNSGYVIVIDGRSDRVIARIPIEVNAPILGMSWIAYSTSNQLIYVANYYTNSDSSASIAVINGSTNVIVGSFHCTCIGGYSSYAYDSARSIIFAPGYSNNVYLLYAVSTENNYVLGNFALPSGTAPTGMAFDPYNGNVYIANRATNTVSVISTR